MERLPEESYTQDTSDRVYADLYDLARQALKSGRSVVLDAVFAREAERTRAAAIAANTGVAFNGLWLEAPVDVLERRLAERRGDASDADVAVLHKQMTYDLGRIEWQRVDVSGRAADVLKAALRHLKLQ
jgi:predicted kinase